MTSRRISRHKAVRSGFIVCNKGQHHDDPTNPVAYTELHTSDPARARAFTPSCSAGKARSSRLDGPYTMFSRSAGMTPNRDGIPVGRVPTSTLRTFQPRPLAPKCFEYSVAIQRHFQRGTRSTGASPAFGRRSDHLPTLPAGASGTVGPVMPTACCY